jgi:hypothetical protein
MSVLCRYARQDDAAVSHTLFPATRYFPLVVTRVNNNTTRARLRMRPCHVGKQRSYSRVLHEQTAVRKPSRNGTVCSCHTRERVVNRTCGSVLSAIFSIDAVASTAAPYSTLQYCPRRRLSMLDVDYSIQLGTVLHQEACPYVAGGVAWRSPTVDR